MADYQMNGMEPDSLEIDCSKENYKINLIRALNWYSREKNEDDARKYVLEYIKKTRGKEEYTVASSNGTYIPLAIGWVARIHIGGGTLSTFEMDRLNGLVEVLMAPVKRVKKVADKQEPKHNIQEAIEDKARSFIGEYLEAALDNKFSNFDLLETMKQLNVPGPYLRWIEPWVDSKLKQYEYAYDNKDEGYSHYGRVELRKVVNSLRGYKEDLQSYLKVKKASRKPRTIKKKTPMQLVSKIQYQKDFPELNLKSINPTYIIGASTLWVYNTKLRKLGCYKASDAGGLSVKGSSIVGYDIEESIQKTLRKPEEWIPKLMNMGKLQQKKLLSEIKAVDTELSGRISKDIIILKVY